MIIKKIKLRQVNYWRSGSSRYGFFTTAYLKMENNSIFINHKRFDWVLNLLNNLMSIFYTKDLKEPARIYFDIFNQLIIVQENSKVRNEIIIKNVEKHKVEIKEFLKDWNAYKKGSNYI